MSNLALVYQNQSRYDDAEALFLQVLDTQERDLGPQHPDVIMVMANLADMYHHIGRYDDAAGLFEKTVAGAQQAFGPSHWLTCTIRAGYGRTLMVLERYEEADAHLLQAYEGMVKRPGPDPTQPAKLLQMLVELYEGWGKPEQAAEYQALLEEAQGVMAKD
jgi:tetratricopeptide (TPR) repeat protein